INAVTKRIRTEYMKKFRDPKWETFSKCYEDSVKYRLTRRLLEQTHRPLFGEGWDSGSDSSGRSSPKLRGQGDSSDSKPHTSSSEPRTENTAAQEPLEPQVNGEVHTDSTAVSAPEQSHVEGKERAPSTVPPQREQGQYALSGLQQLMASCIIGIRTSDLLADVGVQTRREADKRAKTSDRRRARSADLEKSRQPLTVVDDRWMTEYMRCFSARLR
uniref:Centriole, cilia and spindle-associated protein a n=1 Tax=Astyanax mexicanus TaxID=7994 RepID=A0A8B9HGM4_ASTMX